MLSDREVAALVWLSVALIALLSWKSLRPSLKAVWKAFIAPRLLRLYFLHFGLAAVCVWAAWAVGLWDVSLLKDSILIALSSLLFTMNAYKRAHGGLLFKDLAREVAGVSALLVFFVGLASFSLWIELLLQPLIVTLTVLGTFASRQADAKPVAKLCSVILSVIGVVSVIWTIVSVTQPGTDVVAIARQFAQTVWLTGALGVFAYVTGYFVKLGVFFSRLNYFHADAPLLRIKLAIIFGLHFRLRLATLFNGNYTDIGKERNLRGAVRYVRDFRRSMRTSTSD